MSRRSTSPRRSRSRSSSPPKISEGKQEVQEEKLVTDLLSPDMIEKIASMLEKEGSLGPWMQVSSGTRIHSRPIGSFLEQFFNLPYEIQSLIVQKMGYGSLGNLLSSSKYVQNKLRGNKKTDFSFFDENKEYQRSKYKRFYQLVRNQTFQIKGIPENSTNLTNKEISESITHLNCFGYNLTAIPPLPNCINLTCTQNVLTSLPPLPKCEILQCENNQLTSLPPLSNCHVLFCRFNQLISLPPLPKCEWLFCNDNQLTCLPKFADYQKVFINSINNPLPPALLINDAKYGNELNELVRKYCNH